jgi:hypothetical protein
LLKLAMKLLLKPSYILCFHRQDPHCGMFPPIYFMNGNGLGIMKQFHPLIFTWGIIPPKKLLKGGILRH